MGNCRSKRAVPASIYAIRQAIPSRLDGLKRVRPILLTVRGACQPGSGHAGVMNEGRMLCRPSQ